MVEYSKANVKLLDTQLRKLKTAVKNKTGSTLKTSLKMFDGNNVSGIITDNKTNNKAKKCI